MRLSWRDGLATVAIGAAWVLYGMWDAGTAVTGWSVRGMAVATFALGWVGCVAGGARMGEVFTSAQRDVGRGYVVLASLVGVVALVAGVWAIVAGTQTMIVAMLAATTVLWAIATARHAVTPAARLAPR